MNKGNTPTDFGFLISMYEFMTDISLILFNLYRECQLELVLINLGSFTSKTSSAFNLSNSVGYVMYEWYVYQDEVGKGTASDAMSPSSIKNLEVTTETLSYDSASEVEKWNFGKNLGDLLKQITSF